MKCNVCGRHTQNEEANFCDYCGSSFREQKAAALDSVPKEQKNPFIIGQNIQVKQMPVNNNMAQAYTGTQQNQETEKPVSLLNWLGTYGIFFIPVFGVFAFFIMLFIWAFAGNAPASKRNWARATLIFTPIFLLALGYVITVVSSPMYQELYEKLYQSMY